MANNGYYNRPSDELWWAIFTRDNPNVDYQQNQVRVSQMVPNDNGDLKRNTAGKLVAIPGMGREGEEWLTWNRPLMEDLFKGKEVFVTPKNQQTLGELIRDFNDKFKFQLSERDFYDENIEIVDIPSQFQVRMRPTCLCFQGTLTITVGNPKVHIGELIVNRDLAGLEYPTKQTKKGQAPFYVFERNFTFLGRALNSMFGYDDIISQDQFNILRDVFEDAWVYNDAPNPFNMKGARVVYNGTTAGSPAPCNASYERVILIQLSDPLCSNFAGHLTMHYNVL